MIRIHHARAIAVAVPAWCWALFWLWPRALRAESLSRDFRLYDWNSLIYAALLGLLGGALALIVALATDRRVVLEVFKESGRNALVSPIAGAAAYLLLNAAGAMGWFTASTEPRFLLIVGSGWAGIAFFQWIASVAGKGAAAVGDWLITRGKS
jgi:hypothetical protein